MESVLDIITDSVIDAAKDTLYVIPFLLITYIIMELIEHKLSNKAQESIKKTGVAGPAIGALLGAVPQCGFSAAASAFYAGRVITIGTLFAVYLSTSDEMIPIFIAGGIPIQNMILIVISKVAIGMLFGFLIDFALKRQNLIDNNLKIHELCKQANCDCSYDCKACKHNPSSVYQAHDLDGHQDIHGHVHDHSKTSIIKSSLIHTLQITLFIFLITFVINILIAFFGGHEVLANFCGEHKLISVLVSGLVGLIPNCAASVVIAQLYVNSLLGLGACMAGLLSAAGIGLLVLIKINKPWKENIIIIISLYLISIICGTIISFIYG